MCGFVGMVESQRDGSIDYRSTIREMGQIISHRGPDSDGYYVGERAALGFKRLAIVDLVSGDQPMRNARGNLVLCFNGEIYNYQELRAELVARGRVFRTQSDTEVVLQGYEEWGEEVLDRLRGMFAFAVYDSEAHRLFAARDIFGIKPLYYYIPNKNGSCGPTSGNNGDSFATPWLLVASEIKAFLGHPKFERSINERMIPQYLCYEYIPNDETLFEGVFKLLAGHCLVYEDGRARIKRYHQIKYHIDEELGFEAWSDLIARKLEESCKLHLNADVEVGCFLSAGVDSSFVAHEVAAKNSMKSFSIGYKEQRYSELASAQEFARQADIRNYSSTISAQDFMDAVPWVQYHMDEPLPNPSAIPLYYLAQEASKQVKVVLSGEGADELFGGYTYYQECLAFEPYMKVPSPLRRLLGNAASLLPSFHGRRFLMRGRYDLSGRYIRSTYVYGLDEALGLMDENLRFDAPSPFSFARRYFDEVAGEDEVTQMQYADMNLWMMHDILQKADKMSMAHSLELRVPFLDREMLEVALSIPSRYRVTKKQTKLALRAAAQKKLPPKTAAMPKIGFITPLNDWLRQDNFYTPIHDVFSSGFAADFFDRNKAIRLLDDHKNGSAHNMKKIWSIYCFLIWYEEFFVKRPLP